MNFSVGFPQSNGNLSSVDIILQSRLDMEDRKRLLFLPSSKREV